MNLGIKVPPERLVAAVREHHPDILGLSGLLVKSAHQMVATAEDLSRAGVRRAWGAPAQNLPSRFLAEIPADLLDWRRTEADQVRWADADELSRLDFLPANAAVVALLADRLRARPDPNS